MTADSSLNRLLPTRFLPCLAVPLLSLASGLGFAQDKNGFDLRDSLVPAAQILSGGPAKDGIPAIDKPVFVAAGKAPFLRAEDLVLGLQIEGQARAYPLRIMNWHEIVNDQYNDSAVVITYCPLCGSGVAFDRRVGGHMLDFGVSGLLYNSDVLLYDRQTQSLWSQLLGKAISGPMKGQTLKMLPMTQTSWDDWRRAHPASQVLSTATGHDRPYGQDAYPGYEDSPQIMFPVAFRSAGYHPKERVLGVQVGTLTRAYPFVELGKLTAPVNERLGDVTYIVYFDRNSSRASAQRDDGTPVPAVVAYWFAWYAFHPDTQIFHAKAASGEAR